MWQIYHCKAEQVTLSYMDFIYHQYKIKHKSKMGIPISKLFIILYFSWVSSYSNKSSVKAHAV